MDYLIRRQSKRYMTIWFIMNLKFSINVYWNRNRNRNIFRNRITVSKIKTKLGNTCGKYTETKVPCKYRKIIHELRKREEITFLKANKELRVKKFHKNVENYSIWNDRKNWLKIKKSNNNNNNWEKSKRCFKLDHKYIRLAPPQETFIEQQKFPNSLTMTA